MAASLIRLQVDIHAEYDLVQLIGEGWFSRVYLAEHRTSRDEVVIKAINSNSVTAEEFCREYQNSTALWPHKNILKVYDAVFQCQGYYMFAMEYALLGDLTANITELGLGEVYTKRVTCQAANNNIDSQFSCCKVSFLGCTLYLLT